MGKFTVYDLLELFGKVVFGDESRNEVYTWNGDYHFASWRPDEEGFFHNMFHAHSGRRLKIRTPAHKRKHEQRRCSPRVGQCELPTRGGR